MMSGLMRNYYSILGVPDTASEDEIRAVYLRKAKVLHPDRNHTETATQDFQALQEAYYHLKDLSRRSAHDSLLASEAVAEDVPLDATDMALAEYLSPPPKKKRKKQKEKKQPLSSADYEQIPEGFEPGPRLGGILALLLLPLFLTGCMQFGDVQGEWAWSKSSIRSVKDKPGAK